MNILSKYRRLQMEWLYKIHKKDMYRGTVLFWVPGGMPALLQVEGAIAAALKLRGVKTHAIICNGVYKACALRNSNENIPINKWHERCRDCVKQTTYILEGFGISYSFIGDYISSNLKKELKDHSRKVRWKDLDNLTYKNIPLGKNIKSAIIKFSLGKCLFDLEELTQAYTLSAIICMEATVRACNKFKPDKMFMSHGIYVDWGPALNIALSKGLTVSAWMASYLPARFYLRNLKKQGNIDFHGMSDEAWRRISAQKLSPKQNKILNHYLINRYQENKSFDIKRFFKYLGNSDFLRRKYHLTDDKPVWGIMAHINWDAVCDYSPMIYNSFDDWILDTIKEIIKIKEVEWLIKIHPAEAWENTLSGVQKLIEKNFPSLPRHIHLIKAEEKINPLDFIQFISGGITAYGTLGLELALLGKPVILTGEAHYGNKGFTYDCKSIADYKKMLRRAVSIKPLTQKQINLAKKYAYCYFIRRQIPIPVVRDPKSIWWKFNYKKRDLLIPGKDPFMDFICDRIMDGEDFIMDDNLTDLATKIYS